MDIAEIATDSVIEESTIIQEEILENPSIEHPEKTPGKELKWHEIKYQFERAPRVKNLNR